LHAIVKNYGTKRNQTKFVTLGTFETKSSSLEWLYLYKYLSDTRVTVCKVALEMYQCNCANTRQ